MKKFFLWFIALIIIVSYWKSLAILFGVLICVYAISVIIRNKRKATNANPNYGEIDHVVSGDEAFPNVSNYRINPSGKRYDDTYITGIGYKLRELLLLIWCGRTKKPRSKYSKPPRYFFYEYNLKPKEVFKRFIDDQLISVNENNEIILTELGKKIYDEFEALWEIHSYKGYIGELPNLDKVFHNWNFNLYKANNNLLQVRFLKEIIDYNSRMQDKYPVDSDEFNAYQQDIEQDEETIVELLKEHQQLINNESPILKDSVKNH